MSDLWEKPDRLLVLPLALLAGVLFVTALSLALPAGSGPAVLLLDRHAVPPAHSPFVYPFTVQNLMHLLFFVGLGELFVRWRIAERELALTHAGLLPQEYRTVLGVHNLAPIRAAVKHRYDEEHGFLPSLVDLCILQFMASRSVDQTVSVLNSSLELIQHRLDLRYALLRYLVWVIPTIGFIGTVVGIALALSQIDPTATEQPLADIAAALGISFYTTLVALMESAVLVLLLNLVQAREESALNRAGNQTLTNLINRLHVGDATA
ncbi:MotA/TolQ/ExbB proton channel family protein [uncultured Thiohalocapsa sp.]|uniref:MotA/TolQ/ExbB proton channel family protein n=1 Tax=uncultured Thiohalocapsa sp. TaxID=768990 RepID=UPI0025E7A729|nr:MotA/TolQ/ExbB proton channel family protein [uncultured Thiohalocapsa sp.]